MLYDLVLYVLGVFIVALLVEVIRYGIAVRQAISAWRWMRRRLEYKGFWYIVESKLFGVRRWWESSEGHRKRLEHRRRKRKYEYQQERKRREERDVEVSEAR